MKNQAQNQAEAAEPNTPPPQLPEPQGQVIQGTPRTRGRISNSPAAVRAFLERLHTREADSSSDDDMEAPPSISP